MDSVSRQLLASGVRPAVEFVGYYSQAILGTVAGTTIPLNSLTGGSGSAPANGDVVIVVFGIGYQFFAPEAASPTGYTSLGITKANGTYDTQLGVWYKFMGATPDTSVVIPDTGNLANAGAVIVFVFRKVSAVFAETPVVATNTLLADPPSTTPDTDGSMVVACIAGAHNLNAAPAYFGSNLDLYTPVTSDDTVDVSIAAGFKNNLPASVAFNPQAFSFSGTDSTQYTSVAMTLFLRFAP